MTEKCDRQKEKMGIFASQLAKVKDADDWLVERSKFSLLVLIEPSRCPDLIWTMVNSNR